MASNARRCRVKRGLESRSRSSLPVITYKSLFLCFPLYVLLPCYMCTSTYNRLGCAAIQQPVGKTWTKEDSGPLLGRLATGSLLGTPLGTPLGFIGHPTCSPWKHSHLTSQTTKCLPVTAPMIDQIDYKKERSTNQQTIHQLRQ